MPLQMKRVALAAFAGGAAAAVVNVVLFLVLHAAGVDFMIQPDPAAPAAAITVPNFAAASFLPALIAGGLLMLLGRYTRNARRAFLAIAIASALLSLGGPATVGGASTETRVALMVMHLLAAAVITGALLRSAGEKQ